MLTIILTRHIVYNINISAFVDIQSTASDACKNKRNKKNEKKNEKCCFCLLSSSNSDDIGGECIGFL